MAAAAESRPILALPVVSGWTCHECVGAGATGEVWRATNAKGRAAAIKVATERGAIEILKREALRLQQSGRRWGAKILAAGRIVLRGAPAFILVTEWLEGDRLDPKTVAAENRERTAAIVAHGVARALAELHEAGIRHGDVKPDNILMHAAGAIGAVDRAADRGCSLIDLGLATSFDESARGGTAHYASPELRENPSRIDPAADLFALGVVLHDILAGDTHSEPATWSALLTAKSSGARPSAAWIADRAARFLGLATDPQELALARRASVRRAYLTLRDSEIDADSRLAIDLTGDPRTWIEEAIALRRKIHEEPEIKPNGETVQIAEALGPMSALTRARWWIALVGPAAASWPVDAGASEEQLVARALALAECIPLASWTFEDVRDTTVVEPFVAPPHGDDRIALFATELARARPDSRVVALAEDDVAQDRLPGIIALALADALVRSGEIGRASYALAKIESAAADARRAEMARRAGDRETAENAARRAISAGAAPARDAASATLARLAWDEHRFDDALVLVAHARGAAAAEVRALVAYATGKLADGIREIESTQARDVAEQARLEAMRGMLEHARGESAASARAFGRASELAVQSGGVVEEATYLTGLAAAATDEADVGLALVSATRA
ncbi:MAG: protein kinase, partial [Polyangiaceae bacterium]